jgi:hypothetical protein
MIHFYTICPNRTDVNIAQASLSRGTGHAYLCGAAIADAQ